MIARLFNAPMHSADEEALGCSTVGSSEAIILATLAMKRRWQNARKAKGLSTEKPNMVLGANCQVAWHKALLYLEIESREIECTEELLYMDPKKAVDQVDENTIGVCAILGSTVCTFLSSLSVWMLISCSLYSTLVIMKMSRL